MVLKNNKERKDLIRQTESLCNVCLKKIPAETFERGGRIFMKKQCDEHGEFLAPHFWDDPEIYQALINVKSVKNKSANLSIPLTRKCNLDCSVCYANANEKIIRDFPVGGLKVIKEYRAVLLTGGEPTVRNDLPKIIWKIRREGKRAVIFSNGIKLAEPSYLRILKKAGLSAIILQFDTLDEKTAIAMRGKNLIGKKIRAVENILKCNIPLYLYSVVLKKHTPNDSSNILKYALCRPGIKMVSFNTMGMMGRCDKENFYPASQIIKKICRQFKIEKSDWIKSTLFLNTVDKMSFLRGKNRRLFSKCSLKYLVLVQKNKLIPVTRIFNTQNFEGKMNEILKKKKKGKSAFNPILRLVFSEVFLNIFRNQNFRIFIFALIKNLKYLFQKKYSLLNPFFTIAVTVVPSVENIDYKFLEECNIHSINSEDTKPKPACLYRIKKYC